MRNPTPGRVAAVTVLMAALMGLSACSSSRDRNRPMAPLLPPSSVAVSSGEERVSALTDAPEAGPEKPENQLFTGTGQFVNREPPQSRASVEEEAGQITLNFVNAEIRDVLKAVLGDTLGLNYALDESISGRITFQSSRPLAEEDVLPALESALKIHGLALVETDGFIRVMKLADARKSAGGLRLGKDGKVGYGVRIVPLKYISAEEAERVLKPFAAEPGSLTVDKTRNLLFLAGTRDDLNQMEETLALFDVDWFKAMSFGLIYPKYADASALDAELRHLFAREDSPVKGLVDIIPIPRMNALLVITSRADYLKKVQAWAVRLDQRPRSPGRRLYYYRVQNAKAEDLASSLNELFGGEPRQRGPSYSPPPGDFAKEGSNETAGQARAVQVHAPVHTARAARTGDDGEEPPRLVTDEKNNALIIHATPAQFELIEATLQKMDVAPEQVLIEATIAEVTLRDELKYGIDWSVISGDHELVLSGNSAGAVASHFPGFSYSVIANTAQAALSMLSTLTDVNVISSPKIMVLNNQTATLQVGDQVPVITQQSVSVDAQNAPIVNAVQFRDTGVILRVTPRINKSGNVVLEVNQEVSEVVETTTSTINSPTIQQRRIESTVSVGNGQTVALGGLIRESDSLTKDGIPILKDIPLLGYAFSSTSKTKRRTELLVFITPRVARNNEQAKQITEYLRGRLERLQNRLRYGEEAAAR